ncbi:MAG: glycosyltransferase [Pseudomonadota bacterium]
MTGGYYKPSETMVNFHIENLFDGNTCVLSANDEKPAPNDRPFLVYRKPKGLLHRATSSLLHGTVKVPQGRRRAEITDFLKQQGVEIGVSEMGSQTMIVAPVFKAAGIPLVGYFRGEDASKTLRSPRRRRAYRLSVPKLAAVVSVSQFLLDNLARAGITHPNAHVIPSGVDVRRFKPAPDKRPNSFLAVGRFIEKKAPDLVVRAFARAAQEHPAATLEMIGDGYLLERCRIIAHEAGIADRITFHGWQPHSFVAERMFDTQVFLQHSVTPEDGNTEGMPTAIQEAMACGMAVVSTRHAGIPEAVEEGVTGFLVDEYDEAGFAAAIDRAMARPTEVAEMGQEGRARAVSRFDNAVLIARFERLLEQVSQGG